MTKSLIGGLAVCAAALTLAACNKPAEAAAAPAAASTLPADVAALKEKYDLCEHFAGEEPYDDARRKEIGDAIEANCRPVKNALPGIKAKYKDNAEIMALIKPWEEWLVSYD